jgi:hypothetical protein
VNPDRRAALGSKHTCFSCEVKFYDMNRPVPICPRCQADQREAPREPSPQRAAIKPKARAKKKRPPPARVLEDQPRAEEEDVVAADIELDPAVIDDGPVVEIKDEASSAEDKDKR